MEESSAVSPERGYDINGDGEFLFRVGDVFAYDGQCDSDGNLHQYTIAEFYDVAGDGMSGFMRSTGGISWSWPDEQFVFVAAGNPRFPALIRSPDGTLAVSSKLYKTEAEALADKVVFWPYKQ